MYIDISLYHGNMHQNNGFKSQVITLDAWRAILNPILTRIDTHGGQSVCNFTFSDTVSTDHLALGVYRILTNQDLAITFNTANKS